MLTKSENLKKELEEAKKGLEGLKKLCVGTGRVKARSMSRRKEHEVVVAEKPRMRWQFRNEKPGS